MSHPNVTLNDGRSMPQLGFGVWQVPNDEAAAVVREAIDAGYRSIDTAAIHRNEEGVGEAIMTAGGRRESLFIATKLWNDDQGYDATLKAFDASLERLGLDGCGPLSHPLAGLEARGLCGYLASPHQVEAGGTCEIDWRIQLQDRAPASALRRDRDRTGSQPDRAASPLPAAGVAGFPRGARDRQGSLEPPWTRQADPGRAQVILRWHLDKGLIMIPKSVTTSRMRQNIDVFDFRSDADDIDVIDRLDDPGGRIGPDPELFT
jgi:hypothetical protein